MKETAPGADTSRRAAHRADVLADALPFHVIMQLEGNQVKRVFLYVRVSTEEQAIHGLSIEAQTEALQAWAKDNGHKVVGVYTDAGISARKPASKRPELQRLLSDAQAGKGDLVVFTKLDRWFRNIAEYYKVQEILERCRVDWRTIHEDYDTSTASGRLKINIMLSVAQDEADRTSERIKAVFEVKRQKKEPLTGDCPTGYKLDGKRLVKDPEKEEAVTAFFQKYLESGCISAAMECAHEKGLRIYYQLAHKMLSHPAYYGFYFNVEGMTPPYISKSDFDKIQSMRKHVVRKTVKNRVYLFSGLVFCGECGGRMGGRVNTNQASFFYNCTSHYMRMSACANNSNMLERKIEAFLIESIDEKMKALKVAHGGISTLEKKKDLKAEISALKSKCQKVKDLYINDLISLEACKTAVEEYTKKINALESESRTLREPDFSRIEHILTEGWKTIYSDLPKEEKQEFWRLLIKKITVFPDRHVEYEIDL